MTTVQVVPTSECGNPPIIPATTTNNNNKNCCNAFLRVLGHNENHCIFQAMRGNTYCKKFVFYFGSGSICM